MIGSSGRNRTEKIECGRIKKEKEKGG